MDSDEHDICLYLKSWPKQFISGAEISRRAGGKRKFREDPYWANQPLLRLVEKGILESDALGHYKLIAAEKKESRKPKRFVSPQIKKILEDSGKKFEGVLDVEEPGDSF